MVCTFFNDSWEQCKLEDIADIYDGIHETPNYKSEGIMFLSVEDITTLVSNKYISFEDFRRLYKVYPQKDDILMTRIGDVGTPNVVENTDLLAYYVSLALIKPKKIDSYYLSNCICSTSFQNDLKQRTLTTAIPQKINKDQIGKIIVNFPSNKSEQILIGGLFSNLDNLITLHQRECIINGGEMKQVNKNTLLVDYYEQWINVYKEGAIRNVTMKKYRLTLLWLKKIAPKLKLCKLDRIEYQNILNTYALEHERQTTMDFHHQLKGAILDAVDEGYIERDPTRKVIIKGKTPRAKKIKYLNQYELHTLLKNLDLSHGVNFDWLILIIAKTGMRFSEAIALTPKDFDFSHQTLSINKTWDYKESGTFQPTKNKSSVRKIQIDWMVVSQFSTLIKDLPENEPIFVKKPIYNSTINDILKRHCKKNKIPIITVHGLRHTHASLLLFAGVSIASVAQRLGHASMTTTQKTYLHIIQELENKDVDLVMRSLSGLC